MIHLVLDAHGEQSVGFEFKSYAVAINGGEAKGAPTVERIVPPMLERFVSSDREFAKVRKRSQPKPIDG